MLAAFLDLAEAESHNLHLPRATAEHCPQKKDFYISIKSTFQVDYGKGSQAHKMDSYGQVAVVF